MNRAVPSLDTALAVMLVALVGALFLVLAAASFLVGFAIGKFAVGPMLLAALGVPS